VDLTLGARKVYRDLLRTHGDTPETRHIAEAAAIFWQRAEAAAATVASEGLVITNAKGTFPHPAVSVERNSRLGFLTAVRALRQQPKYAKVGRPTAQDKYFNRLFSGRVPPRFSRKATARYLGPGA
jgi:hypothetical protein